MESKIITLLLTGVLAFSLAACGQSGAPATTNGANKEEAEQEIPEAVANISEEDDKALTGTLTEDCYVNPYFGLKFNRPEGGRIESIMDDGTELMPFSQTFTDGYDGIYIYACNADEDGRMFPAIIAAEEDVKGKTEEEIAAATLEQNQELLEKEDLQDDFELGIETVSIAGEEHPVYVEYYDNSDGDWKEGTIVIVKGDFECSISITAHPEKFDEMVQLIEKN